MNILRATFAVPVSCLDAFWVYLKPYHDLFATLPSSTRGLAPTNHKSVMVVKEVSGLSSHRRKVLVADLEPRGVVFVRLVDRDEACRTWQIINDPLCHIAILNELPSSLDTLPVCLVCSQKLAILVLTHGKIVVGCHDPIPPKNLSQVEGDALAADISGVLLSSRWENEW